MDGQGAAVSAPVRTGFRGFAESQRRTRRAGRWWGGGAGRAGAANAAGLLWTAPGGHTRRPPQAAPGAACDCV